ncbi:putative selenium-dependent hydroxylase accessory protein YqeC [Desulfosporosinus orientis DSM 765]|uniref:Putative selenium-dependent hydroxylase accessory protein YqeC n=1 Tax=Desulfosporosinus orientis (strain ATCC 19365 / DSM 765 / NCIMB 8382 / VKM B-1628 / Singapore I) TaxID=768706 RepID=G7W5V0_DESOD|nr:selenium cofactor biosynthesis protein YqeC [Desulfosporosinus orientis]AET67038.1 putative selenium-dependent hydroxylase accessory protein YqeC [Desulfosporosinus orientis DSM 765]
MTSSTTNFPTQSITGSGSLWDMTHRLWVTTFIGAGGKTTCLQTLTHDMEAAGLEVVATTTTKVHPELTMDAWRNLYPPPQKRGAWFWYDGVEDSSGKWRGPSALSVDKAIAEELRTDSRRYWVIEGDGAREHRLKCWEYYEPQIPKYSDCGVLVMDRGLWGKVLEPDAVHRPHKCQDLLGEIWSSESVWRYFLKSPVFDMQYSMLHWVILFNSAKTANENMGEFDPENSFDLLHDLSLKWMEMSENSVKTDLKPSHLRLAEGDAKKGDLRWFDLW